MIHNNLCKSVSAFSFKSMVKGSSPAVAATTAGQKPAVFATLKSLRSPSTTSALLPKMSPTFAAPPSLPSLAFLSQYANALRGALGTAVGMAVGASETVAKAVAAAIGWLSLRLQSAAQQNKKAFAQLPGQATTAHPSTLSPSAKGVQMANAYMVSKLAGFALQQALLEQPQVTPELAKAEAKRLQAELMADYKAALS